MVGRSGAVQELSGSVDSGGSGKLFVAVDAGAAKPGAIPASSGKIPPRSSEQEQRWGAPARRWPGHAGAPAGVVAFPRRIRGDQLRTRDMAVSHVADDAARFRYGLPFLERGGGAL